MDAEAQYAEMQQAHELQKVFGCFSWAPSSRCCHQWRHSCCPSREKQVSSCRKADNVILGSCAAEESQLPQSSFGLLAGRYPALNTLSLSVRSLSKWLVSTLLTQVLTPATFLRTLHRLLPSAASVAVSTCLQQTCCARRPAG